MTIRFVPRADLPHGVHELRQSCCHPRNAEGGKEHCQAGLNLIEQVLVTDAKHYIKHFGASDSGNSFNPPSLKAACSRMPNRMLDSWTSGKSVWIDEEFEALTSKIALKTLFDLDDPGDRERFSKALKLAFDLMTARPRRAFKLPLWMPTPANLRLQRAMAELDRTVQDFIASGRSRRQAGEDVLSRLFLVDQFEGAAATRTGELR